VKTAQEHVLNLRNLTGTEEFIPNQVYTADKTGLR
jgi:hypothetical protein